MTKLKQLSNEFDVLYSRKNNLRIGEGGVYSALPTQEHSSQRILGKSKFYRTSERVRVTRKQGMIGCGDEDFLIQP